MSSFPDSETPVDNTSYSDGMAGIISAGYGSNVDGDSYAIAICDKCRKEKEEAGLITKTYGMWDYIEEQAP